MSSNNLEIVTTADGSKTIYNAEVGEHYHSRNGALQESRHVFVNAGLNFFLDKNQPGTVSILEVGFGTGLNFLLSADDCIARETQLNYTGIEAYPISAQMMAQTGYDKYTSPALWSNYICNYPDALKTTVSMNNTCRLQIANSTLIDFKTAQQYDIIYFDAFASARQPEMWELPAISHAVTFLKPGGIFVTYAITGNLKRMLKSLSFTIEKVSGAAGKREMLRATKDLTNN
jgi:tRNA U34 5-methylaminomethyl-2-thiouridine-forming methyltransferase MnmC